MYVYKNECIGWYIKECNNVKTVAFCALKAN